MFRYFTFYKHFKFHTPLSWAWKSFIISGPVYADRRTQYILTSTKNASIIITDFLAMIIKNEQRRTASYVEVGRYWKMTLIWYAGDALFLWHHTGPTYTWRHFASVAYDFNWNLHPVCFVNVLLINEQILDNFFKQLCLRVIRLWNYNVIFKTNCKVRLRNLPTFSFCFK